MKKKVIIIERDLEIGNIYRLIIDCSSGFRSAGVYNYGEDALKEIPRICPDIALVNLELSGKSGIEITEVIKKRHPHIEVLIISGYLDSGVVFAALKAGASGYLTKDASYLQIISALEELEKGGSPMSSEIARMVVQEFQTNLNSPISKREKQVLQMISEGKTYKEISEELNISKETSKTHIRNIYTKLNVSSKSQALSRAKEDRLIV